MTSTPPEATAAARSGDQPQFAPSLAFTPERRQRFVAALAAGGDVRAACVAVGISRPTAYRRRQADARFAAAWDAALVMAREAAESELAVQALEGRLETVWYRGRAVGKRRRFSPALLLAHLGRLDRQLAALPAARADDAPGAADAALAEFFAKGV
jgi:hypothetical protein